MYVKNTLPLNVHLQEMVYNRLPRKLLVETKQPKKRRRPYKSYRNKRGPEEKTLRGRNSQRQEI